MLQAGAEGIQPGVLIAFRGEERGGGPASPEAWPGLRCEPKQCVSQPQPQFLRMGVASLPPPPSSPCLRGPGKLWCSGQNGVERIIL